MCVCVCICMRKIRGLAHTHTHIYTHTYNIVLGTRSRAIRRFNGYSILIWRDIKSERIKKERERAGALVRGQDEREREKQVREEQAGGCVRALGLHGLPEKEEEEEGGGQEGEREREKGRRREDEIKIALHGTARSRRALGHVACLPACLRGSPAS